MPIRFRRPVLAAFLAAAITGGFVPVLEAASPDFYGIKMNSENHARDLSPDELSLFPVRRGFDKNIYAYAHLDTTFNHTRSITFNVFNNTDNDLLTEKSFREYYVVLRNGERYRLNEPALSLSIDHIDARASATLRADVGQLNVTKEEIEMIVCSFDMGKVKIVLLPIAEEPPAPLPKKEAARLTGRSEKEAAPVSSKDQAEPRRSPEGPVVRTPGKASHFPLMDWPVFSWMKGTSADQPRPKPVPDKKEPAQPRTNVSVKTPAALAPVSVPPIAENTPAKKPSLGLFGTIFSSIFGPEEKSPKTAADGSKKKGVKPASAPHSSASAEKEFFWKPRDLEPIKPIDQYQAQPTKREPPAAVRPAPAAAEARPFYMKRPADESVKIPSDEPVSAVSSPASKSRAPVLKPQKKLRAVTPRMEAKIAQVNRQMGFIIVNAGSADGLKENMVLNVYRQGKVIAKAIVRKVKEDASAALLMKEWAREDVAVGDPVSLY